MKTDLFTTTPQSALFTDGSYANQVRNIARHSEAHGYKGTLIYSDNRLADPWSVAGYIISQTETLLPMIALQPTYMHPYTVAKKIATFGLLYQRQISLNLIAGGFQNDLNSLSDHIGHDNRYHRLIEYTEIIQQLLTSKEPVTYVGTYYKVNNLTLHPQLPENLWPLYYLSGSSDSARLAAHILGAKLIEYPEPYSDASTHSTADPRKRARGIRIGVLARDSHEQAWIDARQRFPETRSGAITHQFATKTSDSVWHKTLSSQRKIAPGEEPVYWLGPFQHYQTFCPYLVGSYDEVTDELSRYLKSGCNTCILDIPVSETELQHTRRVFELAEARMAS